MKYLRIFVAATFCVTSIAHAERFDETPLGPTVPMWYEHSATLNSHDQLAWTRLDADGEPRATLWDDGTIVDLDAYIHPRPFRSYASGIDINGTAIVGYVAHNERETQRTATLWSKNGASWTARTLAPPSGMNVVQSAAYAIARRPTPYADYVVGGYVREAVSPTKLAVPTVWTGMESSMVADTLPVNEGTGYGIVYDVLSTSATNHVACGASGDAVGSYAMATCWELPSKSRTVLGHGVSGGTIASSVVRRISSFYFGALGTARFAIGTAVDVDGVSKGFIYKLSGHASIPAVQWVEGIAAGSSAQLMDVAELTLPGPNGTIDYGMMVVGMGATTSSSDYPTLIEVPVPAGSVYHGVSKSYLPSVGHTGPVCDVQEQVVSGIGEVVVATTINAGTRVVWHDGQLSVYRDRTTLSKPTVHVRDTSVVIRPALDGKPANVQQVRHFQAQVGGTSSVGAVLWARGLGCESVPGGGTPECGQGNAALDTGVRHPIHAASGGVARTAVIQGQTPDPQEYRYVQASLTAGANACEFSEVYATDSVVTMNPKNDFNGESRQWENCDGNTATGYETDVLRDYFHCGACNNQVVEDGKWCTIDQCVNGATDRSQLEANSCHIAGACYASGDPAPIDYGAEPSTTHNDCARCDAGTPQQWTATGAACCNGTSPTHDAFHKEYRPSPVGGNISYNGIELSAPWVARISEVYDSDHWTYAPTGSGNEYSGQRCNANDQGRGPHYLNASLTGVSNQEDWYVFRHRDVGSDSKMHSEPRARLLADANGPELTMCVYVTCAQAGKNLTGKGINGLSYYTYYAAPRTGSEHGGPNQPAAGSPLSVSLANGSDNVAGFCVTGRTPDVEILLEDYNSGKSSANQCWDVDVFVQVKPAVGEPLPTCSNTYKLFWGNDRHYRARTSISLAAKFYKATCLNCCDGSTLNQLSAPL